MSKKINDFTTNDSWSKEFEEPYLSRLYKGLAGDTGQYKFANGEDQWSKSLQQHGIDVELFRYGKTEWDDYKIVQWPGEEKGPYDRICFETRSCTKRGHESEGWMHTCRADYLLYCFVQKIAGLPTILDAYRIEFKPLQKWFWSLDLTQYHISTENERNRTRSVLIPIIEVLEAFPDTQRYFLTSTNLEPVTKHKKLPITEIPGLFSHYRNRASKPTEAIMSDTVATIMAVTHTKEREQNEQDRAS